MEDPTLAESYTIPAMFDKHLPAALKGQIVVHEESMVLHMIRQHIKGMSDQSLRTMFGFRPVYTTEKERHPPKETTPCGP